MRSFCSAFLTRARCSSRTRASRAPARSALRINPPKDAARFDIQSLRIVRAISDTGSITAAAAALGYSQPAVSQHVRRLETRLGVAILERVGRGVRLTEAGRRLGLVGEARWAAFCEKREARSR